jgi:CRP/FNR family transcriptional regulator, cyclic AMP receptor protein
VAATESPVELLQRVPLFSGLSRKELESIARSLHARTFSPGEVIAREGESGVAFFLIADGSAKVSVGGRDVGSIGPGDYFGEIALIADTERTATVTADGEMRCYGLTRWEFRPLVETNAQVAWKLLEAVARKIREAEQREG